MAADAVNDLIQLEDRYRAKAERLSEAAALVVTQPCAGLSAVALPAFLRRYYWQAPVEDILDRSPEELYRVARAHYELGALRAQGSVTVRAAVLSDDASQMVGMRTVVQIVIEDMPFLVDSVTAEISRQGRRLHHLVHPVLVVRRDITGVLQEVCDTSDPMHCPADGSVESWMHIEIDRETDPDALRRIEADLRRVLTDVREAVEDWPKMRAAAVRVARELENNHFDLPRDELAEAAELLRWLADDHFTFLGYREYTLVRDDDGYDALSAGCPGRWPPGPRPARSRS